MNYYYTIVIRDEEKNHNTAAVLKVNEAYNLLSKLKGIKNLYGVHPAETKKKAFELANFWNECYLNNGTYPFDRVYPAMEWR